MSDPWETRVDPTPPKQAISPAMIAVIASSVLVLSVAGAVGGWLLGGTPKDGPSNQPSASVTHVASGAQTPSANSSPSSSPSVSPSESSSASPTPTGNAGSFPLPDPGSQPFQDYYAQLRSLSLGVQLIFDEQGEDGKVVQTQPLVGAEVHAGITVKVYVAGPAPLTQLPSLKGKSCRVVASLLTPVGLKPHYMSGKLGIVTRQNPDPLESGTARWNDQIDVWCE